LANGPLLSAQDNGIFVHPGILSTREDLDQLRATILEKPQHPRTTYYSRMKNWEGSSYRYRHQALPVVKVKAGGVVEEELRFRRDAQAAYACALQWVITGDVRFFNKSKQILNDWADTFVRLETVRGKDTIDQLVVEAGWATPIWVAAAEIVRHHNQGEAAWPKTEIKKFSKFLDKLWEEFGKLYYGLLPQRTVQYRCNWGTSAALSMICVGVFQDNLQRFQDGIAYWKELLPLNVERGGEIFETCRDCYHPGYALNTLIQGAEIAHNQGLDLYGVVVDEQPKPRLWYGLEYRARRVLGLENPVPLCFGGYANYRSDCSSCYQCWYEGGWEIGLNHYKKRVGMECENAERLVRKAREKDFGFDEHFVSFATLTHGNN
jgi:hypothetical protein